MFLVSEYHCTHRKLAMEKSAKNKSSLWNLRICIFDSIFMYVMWLNCQKKKKKQDAQLNSTSDKERISFLVWVLPVQYLGHTYTASYLSFTWNSHLTRHPVFFLAKSGNLGTCSLLSRVGGNQAGAIIPEKSIMRGPHCPLDLLLKCSNSPRVCGALLLVGEAWFPVRGISSLQQGCSGGLANLSGMPEHPCSALFLWETGVTETRILEILE